MLLVRLPINSRLLVKFWGSQKFYTDFQPCGVGTSSSHIAQGSTVMDDYDASQSAVTRILNVTSIFLLCGRTEFQVCLAAV